MVLCDLILMIINIISCILYVLIMRVKYDLNIWDSLKYSFSFLFPFSTGSDTCRGSLWWGLRQWPFAGFASLQRSTANLCDYLGLSREGLHRCLEEWQGPWAGLPLTVVSFVNIPDSLWYSSVSWASSECPCCFWPALLSCLVKQTRWLH